MTAVIKEKHLDLLQGVINRMAGNSFLLRGWSVTLVSALLTLGANHAQPLVVAIALLPVFTFWGTVISWPRSASSATSTPRSSTRASRCRTTP
jgi:hypothetical protein